MAVKTWALPLVLLAASAPPVAASAGDPAPASAVYTLTPDPLNPGTVSTSPTITVGSGTTVDDFTFDIAENYNTSSTGLYFEMPAFGLSIDSAELVLYAGTPTNPGQEIADTGVFNPLVATQTLGSSLTSGDYFLQSIVSVPAGASGAFSVAATVSAAPEPATWALMLLGVGGAGAMLRRRRRLADRETLTDYAAA